MAIASTLDTLIARLANFRMLEAAGMCDFAACAPPSEPQRTTSWWTTLAIVIRNYRSSLISDSPMTSSTLILDKQQLFDNESQEIATELDRVVSELNTWNNDVPCGKAYTSFLQGYAGIAELDSKRGPQHLARALRIGEAHFPLNEYLSKCALRLEGGPISDLEVPISTFEACQATAKYLKEILQLNTSPLDELRRFAIIPPCLTKARDKKPQLS